MKSSHGRIRIGKYELGRTLGEGSFAKVKFARNVETGSNVAIKILDKEKLLKHKMISQVMASKTKIYIVLEFVTGGELFDKILINAVDYCHSRAGESATFDSNGALKVSDFGLSALPQQVREDGLLHTTCGTPNYVAPEVVNSKGYDGAKADLWSCGVILFVLMAGYLPFEDSNLMALYKKIFKADFTCPPWFSTSAKKLVKRILDPNPLTDSGNLVVESREDRPVAMNAFELISTSQGLNLSTLFEKQAMKLLGEKTGRKGHLSIATEFYKSISTGLGDIVWKSGEDTKKITDGAVAPLL
ncbi:hypothetical protein IFM89_026766 [Coptis chinensis]|uniref:non-specific serine/threonine protein kinase n=1 Tax=Coptis chinensis TaxID=261450 RepID=A0A835IU85_9MAGN|nr:hypothetical protein IFM89_026766 [Coptis chinensis]